MLAGSSRVELGIRDVALVACDSADVRIGEGPHECEEGVGGEDAVRIREDEHLAACLGHRGVERGGLADTSQRQEANLTPGEGPDDLIRAVVASVRNDDDLEEICRVVQRGDVLEFDADVRRLVVGGDDQSERGRDVGPEVRPWTKSRTREHEKRKHDVRGRDGTDGRPEDDSPFHAGTLARAN